MQHFEQTLPTPAENLALDEALLLSCEAGETGELLRFWEPAGYFAVLGYSGRAAAELYLDRCGEAGVPVHRRMSGGGTVLQGPGCLSYSLILKIPANGPLSTLSTSNGFIMDLQRQAVSAPGREVKVEGITDLALEGLKFSGNAQRRLKKSLLFHGTFLLDFNIPLIEKYLRPPAKQPAYRQNRGHGDFLINFPENPEKVKDRLKRIWRADQPYSGNLPKETIQHLTAEKYGRKEWNLKF